MISEGYQSAYQQGYSDAKRDFRKKSKTDVLDEIRAEIAGIAVSDGCGDYLLGFNFGLMRAALIIDKYRSESED